eukprot:Seg3922.3 transcript_id=Seg3922.3/GoldUCD/mRNA.D3Y31 product="hypothetical protein" protein_id=Seg3922.3/GoldUCD/D3Y31
MYSTRNISNGFSKFLNATTVLTTPFARNIPAVAVKHKEPILKDTKLNYAAPTGNLSVTTNLLGEKKLCNFINFCAAFLLFLLVNVLHLLLYAFLE